MGGGAPGQSHGGPARSPASAAPRGTIHLTDTEYGSLRASPPDQAIEACLAAFVAHFNRHGDAHAGPQLGQLLERAGFTAVVDQIVGIHQWCTGHRCEQERCCDCLLQFITPERPALLTSAASPTETGPINSGDDHFRQAGRTRRCPRTVYAYQSRGLVGAVAGKQAAASAAVLEDWLKQRAEDAPPPRTVDLGCGDLALLARLLRRLPPSDDTEMTSPRRCSTSSPSSAGGRCPTLAAGWKGICWPGPRGRRRSPPTCRRICGTPMVEAPAGANDGAGPRWASP